MEERKGGCEACDAKLEHIQALQEALGEVVDQNEAFRARVVELEAWVNKASDKLDSRDKRVNALKEEMKQVLEKVSEANNKTTDESEKAN